LGDPTAVWGGRGSDYKPPLVPTLKRVLSRGKGLLGDSNNAGDASVYPTK
jgi:hypothetical protein